MNESMALKTQTSVHTTAAREHKDPKRAHITDSKQGSILFWTSLLINAFQVLQKLHLFARYNLKFFFFFSKNVQSEQKFPILYKTQWTLKSDSSITF